MLCSAVTVVVEAASRKKVFIKSKITLYTLYYYIIHQIRELYSSLSHFLINNLSDGKCNHSF